MVLLLAGCAADNTISARLPIPVQDGALSAYYHAVDAGFYAEEGLDVEYHLGNSETNPVKMVGSGVNEFGILGGPDTLLVARSRGHPLVAIGVAHRNSDFPVLITLKESGITEPKQLEGKKVGFFYGHISTDVIKTLLSSQNVSYDAVDVGFDYLPLITGQVDAEWAWRTTGAVNVPHQGYPVNIISPAEYGIPVHGVTIFTTEEMIANKPETVKKFLKATLKGFTSSIENPEIAVESVMRRDSSMDKELELWRLKEYNTRVSNSEEYPPGYMDHEMFQETYDRVKEQGLLHEDFDVRDAYTTRFLEEIYAES